MLKTCIIIEDQPPAQRILQKYINDIGSLELKKTFNNAIEAIPFLQQNAIDLIFLDIHLPKISGIEFLKTLRSQSQVILTTAFSDYALESYEYNIVDYLLKPFSFQRFVQAITKATQNKQIPTANNDDLLETSKNDSIFIKSGYDIFKINLEDIFYIKSDIDYTEVVTTNKTYLSSNSLKNWLQKINKDFCQVHKSYIINTEKIIKVSGNRIFIKDQIIPIGRAFKVFFQENYLNGSL